MIHTNGLRRPESSRIAQAAMPTSETSPRCFIVDSYMPDHAATIRSSRPLPTNPLSPLLTAYFDYGQMILGRGIRGTLTLSGYRLDNRQNLSNLITSLWDRAQWGLDYVTVRARPIGNILGKFGETLILTREHPRCCTIHVCPPSRLRAVYTPSRVTTFPQYRVLGSMCDQER